MRKKDEKRGDIMETGNAIEQLKNIKCFVLDMDGTIYTDEALFPFTEEFLARAKETGRRTMFFTNNSSSNKKEYLAKMARFGAPVPEEDLHVSIDVLVEFLQREHPDATIYPVCTPGMEEALREGGCHLVEDNADILVLGFDTTLTYEKIDKAVYLLEAGALYYSAQTDIFHLGMHGHKMPDCGAIAALLESVTGMTPRSFGKPAKETLEYIKRRAGVEEHEIAVVGDLMYTDIATAVGTEAMSILVLTGETSMEDLEHYDFRPDLILDSLADLTPLLD